MTHDRKSDNRVIGIANLRHTLTEKFINSSHIGYSVRPTERRKGYATEILKQLFIYAKEQGMCSLELVRYGDNVGSIKTITSNGGTLLRMLDGKNVYSIIIHSK